MLSLDLKKINQINRYLAVLPFFKNKHANFGSLKLVYISSSMYLYVSVLMSQMHKISSILEK